MNDSKKVTKKRGRSHTIQEIADALRSSGGIVLAAAEKLGLSREAVYKRMQESEELRQAQRDGDERVDDMAEGKLITGIRDGRKWAVEFRLKTKGRKRGYVQRHELGGPDGGAIPHRHSLDFSRVLPSE